ncbi:MAG: GDP-L-fucose synthase [Planctomycetaceae bacterium]|nr:GDP-L-fucose synthase [Planctomycetaceae bacterium]
MDSDSRILVAGHTGLIGSAVCRALRRQGHDALILPTRQQCDLTDRAAVEDLFRCERPQYVFLLAAMSGGIKRNATFPAEMIRTNLAIATNVIDAAHRGGVEKLLFPGSACAYPRLCPMPIQPGALLSGPLEPTNEPFAVAKIAGMRMCQAYHRQYGARFIVVVPATVYGPGDHFDENGHVVAALIARFHGAKLRGESEAVVWGSGRPRREFIYVDDVAEAMIFLMNRYDGEEIVHIGSGRDIAIADLAAQIAHAVGYSGRIIFDSSAPDGMPRRLLDSGPLTVMGVRPKVSLEEGLAATCAWYERSKS